jgi:hypothetical protein
MQAASHSLARLPTWILFCFLIWLEKYFWSLELQKQKKHHFFVDFFSIFFWVPSKFFRFFSNIFFSFFILLHVKLSSLSMGVPLAEKSHKPIFLKSRDGCPEFENLRNKNIFGLEDFSGPKKSEYFVFFIFRKKKHYTVPIGGLWPEIK